MFLYFVHGMACAVGRPTVGETAASCIGVVSRGGGCCVELRAPFYSPPVVLNVRVRMHDEGLFWKRGYARTVFRNSTVVYLA